MHDVVIALRFSTNCDFLNFWVGWIERRSTINEYSEFGASSRVG